MPASRESAVQNPGVLATHLALPGLVPVTGSQPLAWTVTGWNCRRPDMNSSTYPPPTSIGHCQTACGIVGNEQMTCARLRAFPRSATTMAGTLLGSGLVPPI